MLNLSDKVALITGASSGIGAATAQLLAARGARVVLCARRLPELETLTAGILANGGQAACLVADVTQRADLARAAAFALERYGRLDVLVSNAGIAPISRFDELRVEDWDAMIDVNLRGVLHGIAAALPIFRRQGAGHFVNVVSTSGLQIVPAQGVYAATKNAVRTLSEALRQEAGKDLRVTVVSPGYVRTNLANSMSNEEVRARVVAHMAELAIEPEAVARAIAYAIEQPADVDVGDLVIRPTAQA